MVLYEEDKAKTNPVEKMRVRLAAEGYHKLETNEKDVENEPEEHKHKSTTTEKRLTVLVITCLLIIAGLAITLVIIRYTVDNSPKTCQSPECVLASGSMLAKMDLTASPCDDFYQYACGRMEKDPLIPPDRPKWSLFAELGRRNQAILKRLLDKPKFEIHGENSTAIEKLKTFYKSCMNTTAIEAQDNENMFEIMKAVGAWTVTPEGTPWSESTWELETSLAASSWRDSAPLFIMAVTVDNMNAHLHRLVFDESGLTLAHIHYLRNDTDKYHDAYIDFFTRVGELLGGGSTTRAKAEDVWNFEKSLAKIWMVPEERTDVKKMYNVMTVQQLHDLLEPGINLRAYINKVLGEEVSPSEKVIVKAPRYLKDMSELVKSTSKETLANYITWQLIQSMIMYMPLPYRLALLKLKEVMVGVSSSHNQWLFCVSNADSVMGYATAGLFVQETFSEKDKENVETVLYMIRESFLESLPKVSWMDEVTKPKAVDKAESIIQKIGFPDFITKAKKLDEFYEELTFEEDDLFNNMLRSYRFYIKKVFDKRHKAVDRTEWNMNPAEVNAYYNPSGNEIVFPSGILQHPFYDPSYAMAINFGAIGMVMGHELTHGFDNIGRMFNKNGSMQNWWTNNSANGFTHQTECLKTQYSQYKVFDSHVNGNLTLAENIADNGGLKTSYKAYQAWLSRQGSYEAEAHLPGLNTTEDQLFFLSFAQVWCSFYTPEYAIQSLTSDSHTYAKYRVIGVLSNMPEFASAFSCQATDKMNPANKCSVW